MQNILIGFKRFISNRNTVTIIALVACVFILYFFYSNRIQKATDPVSVPYAVTEIAPRTKITADMVATRKVPGGIVKTSGADVYTSTSQIINLYVKNDSVIPKGSMFYKSALTDDWTEAKISLYDSIQEGNTLVSLPVTIESTYGNSIFPGNYIDLYFVGVQNNKLLLGKFIESIKVLGVIDSDGNNVFEKLTSNVGSPAYLVFSVPEEYYLLLQKASYLSGNIFPVPRNASYSNNPHETRISSAAIQQFILEQTVDIDEMNENFNPGGVTEFPADGSLTGIQNSVNNNAQNNEGGEE